MLSNSKSAYHEHDHQRCINAALGQARELCASSGARLTPIREAVLQLIWRSHKPLGAYAIAEQLPSFGEKRVLAPSVYRAIDFLLKLGLIHRIPSLNAYIGCPFPGSRHSDLFMICRLCGSAAELSAERVDSALTQASERTGFQVESQTVELLGLCPTCQPGTDSTE